MKAKADAVALRAEVEEKRAAAETAKAGEAKERAAARKAKAAATKERAAAKKAKATAAQVEVERDEEREDKEDLQELAEQLCRSENTKMSEIDKLKNMCAQKDRKIAELQAALNDRDRRLAELAGLRTIDETLQLTFVRGCDGNWAVRPERAK